MRNVEKERERKIGGGIWREGYRERGREIDRERELFLNSQGKA